jgi:hypothetical protein
MPWERRTRSLMAQGIVVFLLLTAGSWLGGCGGPSVGQVAGVRTIYFDEAYYRQAAELGRAGGSVGLVPSIEAYTEGKCRTLYAGSRVRVVKPDADGFKVQVVKATRAADAVAEAEKRGLPRDDEALNDRVGWMTRDAIETALR